MPYSVAQPASSLSSLPVTPKQIRFVYAFIFISALIFAALAPFAQVKLPAVSAFIPLYQSALVINDLLTAAALYGIVRSVKSRRILLLASAYLFTAIMTVAHTLSFPGLFSTSGLLGAGIHSTAWIYAFWHSVFPALIIAYVLTPERLVGRWAISKSVALVVCAALSFTALATAGAALLPAIFDHGKYTSNQPIIFSTVWLFSAAGLVVLTRKRPRLGMDAWLLVVLWTWLFEIALACVLNAGRFDIGFYAGRTYGLISSVTLLFMLMRESTVLHGQLALMLTQEAASREREASQRVLAAVLTQMSVGVIVFRDDTDGLFINKQAASILGIAERDVSYTHSSNAGSCSSLDGLHTRMSSLRATIMQIQAGAVCAEVDIAFEDQNGTRFVTVSGGPVMAAGNSILATVVVLNDVTAERQAEQVLQATLTRLRYLIDNTPLGVIEFGPSLAVTGWNDRAEELFGWQPDEIMGCPLEALPIMHEDERVAVGDLVRQIHDPKSRYVRSSLTHRSKTGDVKNFEWYTSILHDESGKIAAAFSLVLDVTDRVKALCQLQEADRAKDMQLVTIAHELRNPLSPIAHAAMLMRSKQFSTEKLTWAAELITRQTGHMSRLLDDLLDVTRIASGKIKLEVIRCDLTQIINDALEMSKPLLLRCGHTFALDLPGTAVYVDADSMRLTQVVTNLLNNASKYTEPGGHIDIRLRMHGLVADVTISDNGVGIATDMLVEVFQPFKQVDRASHLSRGGLGIGLALVKGIVELHGGKVTAVSDGHGKGSTFTVSLPHVTSAQESAHYSSLYRPLEMLGRTILVADDNVDGADALAKVLINAGATVEVAYDGGSALDIVASQRIDIAILDIQMPVMNGRDLAERLRLYRPKPLLISLSSFGQQEDEAANLRSGFDRHYTKPLSPEEMLKILNGAH